MAWTIDASGVVIGANVTDSTIHNANVEACVLHQVRAWHFPTSDAASYVGRFPFSFGIER